MFSEEVKKTTAALFKGEVFVGSGVIFVVGDTLYVLTAAHNVYGNKFDKEFVKEEWRVTDYQGRKHNVIGVNENIAFSKVHDIALLLLAGNVSHGEFLALKFAPRPHTGLPTYLFRGYYGTKADPVNKEGIKFQENYKESPYQFLGTIDKEQLADSTFNYGSEWMGGFSGSGLFMENREEIICTGILLEIPDKGDNGQLHFCSAEAFVGLGLEMNLLPAEIYDFNPDLFKDEWYKAQVTASITALGERYTPKINFELPIARMTDGLTRGAPFKKQLDAPYAYVFKKHRQCYTSLRTSLLADQKEKIDRLLEQLKNKFKATIFNGFSQIDFKGFAEICDGVLTELDISLRFLYKAQDEKEKEKPTPRHGIAPYHNEIQELYGFKGAINKFKDFIQSATCRLANNPFLILKGEAGYGKSHLLGDISQMRNDKGLISLFFLGHHLTNNDSVWHQLLQGQLNVTANENEFLGQLNLKAHLKGQRILLVVDAINEGNGRQIWENKLETFIKKVRQYDGLGLIISVRTSYHDLLVPKTLYNEKLVEGLTHRGLSENEYEATDYFFDNYGIKKPRIPFLHPEFRSPLFLKLFCDGLKAKRLTEIPEGYEGISAILKFFLEAINDKLSGQLNYDENVDVVGAAVNAFAKEIILTKKSYVPYTKAVTLLAGLETSRLANNPGKLTHHLIEEGVLAKNLFVKDDGSHEDGVYFLYERFLDHIVAASLIRQISGEPATAFQPGGALFDYFKDCATCNQNMGLVEAFSIQIPERYSNEFFEFVPHIKECRVVSSAAINSIVWRKVDSFSKASPNTLHQFFKEFAFPMHGLERFFLETILLITSTPGHPFNAEYVHMVLFNQTLQDRDAGFLRWLTYNYDGDDSEVKRLIDWAWKDEVRKELGDESILLSAITLSWFLISPYREIRDGATKAIICLLQYRGHLVVQLVKKFEKVNDPYVYQRLFCIAYGCVMRSDKLDYLPALCNYIYECIFNQTLVYPDILLRDYARGIIEFAEKREIQLDFDASICKPPYRSEPFPDPLPTTKQIDAAYKLKSGEDDNYLYQNRILSSMTTEYGRGTSGYGDFGRYTFGSALHDWNVNDSLLSNYGIQRIFELGFDIKKHGNYDANKSSGDGKERIGKKYQWIVLYEILARIADQFEMIDESDGKTHIPYRGPWQPHVRDIDPSMIIKKTFNTSDLSDDGLCWWVPRRTLQFNLDNQQWMNCSDEPTVDCDQIAVRDAAGIDWLCLEIRVSVSEETDIEEDEYHVPKKNYYKQIRACLVTDKEFEKVKAWLPKRNKRNDDLPELPYQTQVFSREYYWSDAFLYHQEPYYGGNGDTTIYSRSMRQRIADVHIPIQYILWEKTNDHSIEETISFFKPSTRLFEGLQMAYMHAEGELSGPDGELVCFDPSVNTAGPSSLLVRKDKLIEYLAKNNMVLCWTVDGEKRIFSNNNNGDLHNPRIEHRLNGFYYLEGSELRGSTEATIKKY